MLASLMLLQGLPWVLDGSPGPPDRCGIPFPVLQDFFNTSRAFKGLWSVFAILRPFLACLLGASRTVAHYPHLRPSFKHFRISVQPELSDARPSSQALQSLHRSSNLGAALKVTPLARGSRQPTHMGGCQSYGPFLDRHYNTAPNI